jgi:hypothetical protein
MNGHENQQHNLLSKFNQDAQQYMNSPDKVAQWLNPNMLSAKLGLADPKPTSLLNAAIQGHNSGLSAGSAFSLLHYLQ